jgi:hypothetical protein
MNRVSSQFAAVLMLSAAVLFGAGTAFAQSSGSSGGGSSGGSSSAGASRGGGSAASVGRTGAGSMAPRVGSSGVGGTNDPRSLSNQPATSASPGSTAPGTYSPGTSPAPAGTSTPSGTGYPPGPALEAARQRALQGPAGTVPPSAAGVGADRSSTSEVGSDSVTEPQTPGLPNQAQSNRDTVGNPERLAGGGRSNREGARGATMEDCEAAWDAETHMSKETWRETCRRTLTEPHR